MDTVMPQHVRDLIIQRRTAGLISLPLSTSFRPGVGRDDTPLVGVPRPSSQTARRPFTWRRTQREFMDWHREERDDGQRGRCECCGVQEGSRYRRGRRMVVVELQAAHMDWQPDNCDWDNLCALCPDCHRCWDKVHQEPSSGLTMACEGSLTYEKYCEKLTYTRHQVREHGAIRLTPGAVDLFVAVALQDGPVRVVDLPERLERWAPMLDDALRETSSETELPRVIASSLTRMGMRRLDATGEPLVVREFDTVRLSLERLHVDPSIVETPHTRWTAPRYVAQRRAY